MPIGFCALIACLLFASAAAADTVYKYRRPDGRTIYSNRLEPGLELIETFDYKFAGPAPSPPGSTRATAEEEVRIRKQLDALQAAWTEVQDATQALAAAEERLGKGPELQDGDRVGVASGIAPPGAGGVPAGAPPAIGGPMSGHRGRPSPEYLAKVAELERDVSFARARLDAALHRYNQLR